MPRRRSLGRTWAQCGELAAFGTGIYIPPIQAHAALMGDSEDRHEQALRHVTRGRTIIERQRALIERQKTSGADTKQSEELLDRFEASQAIFEDDLDRFSPRQS